MAKKKKWSIKYKRSIDCSNPKGFSQKQYCKRKARGGKYKTEEVMEEEDLELLEKKKKQQKGKKRARKVAARKKKKDDRCTRIAKRKYDVWPSAYASGAVVQCRRGKIWKGLKEEDEVELNEEFEELLAELVKEELNEKRKKAGTESSKEKSLRDWFGRKGAPGKKGGWVDCNTCRKDKKTGRMKCKPCGRSKGEKRAKYPSCRPTPSACKERGRGKTWGKKAAKKKKTNEGTITEAMIRQVVISEMQKKHFLPGLLEHAQKGIPVHQNFYRVGSPCFFNMFKQARHWAKKGLYEIKNEDERWFLEETDIGETAIYEGQEVQLDFPMLIEAEYQGKKVELNKPKRGGSKKFYVYVKDGDKVKKVSFGSPDMPLNISDDEARASFVARHKCKEKKPRTSAGYWACRTGRYPHLTGSKKRYTWW
jgi:hypothetical protein